MNVAGHSKVRPAGIELSNLTVPGRLLGLVLVLATLLAYYPVWRAGFIWDDDYYVTHNELLTSPGGLRRIWFSFDAPSQYFPLTYTAFYFERLLWGLAPSGYHCVNILLHAANALLAWRVLERLRVSGAWLAALLFVLHPVQVESVAWISELKNVLMAFFFLLALLAWTRFVDETTKRPGPFYGATLACYLLALFAKTTACTLPAALLLVLWLQKIPISWRRLAQVVPFGLIGGAMGLLTMFWERYHQGTYGALFSIGPAQRLLLACRALWFYAGKLLWPTNLTFSYPRWKIAASDPMAYLWLFATIALLLVILKTRRRLGRGVEVASLFFAATLAPLLGFVMAYTFRYTFVADHYQYLACLGPLALAAAAIETGSGWLGKRLLVANFKPLIPAALALLLGVLTWRQCGQYAGDETLWRTTVARNPGSWMARDNLGKALHERGARKEAIRSYHEALEIEANFPEGHNDLGAALADSGQVQEAIREYQTALRLKPNLVQAHYNLGNALVLQDRLPEAIAQYRQALCYQPAFVDARVNLGLALLQAGQPKEAIDSWEQALAIKPDYPKILNRLAWLLATAPDPTLRNGAKAVALALRAKELTGGREPAILYTLAAAYAEAGRYGQASATAQAALSQAEAQTNSALAGALREEIRLFGASQPIRAEVPKPPKGP